MIRIIYLLLVSALIVFQIDYIGKSAVVKAFESQAVTGLMQNAVPELTPVDLVFCSESVGVLSECGQDIIGCGKDDKGRCEG